MEIRTKPITPIDKRQPSEEKKYIDLGAFYNFAISEEIPGKPENTIPIPAGINDFNGVKFDARGIIQLASKVSFEKSHILYPEKITLIPVNTTAKKLCFLLSSAWESAKGTEVDIEKSTDTGLGFNLAYIDNGEWTNQYKGFCFNWPSGIYLVSVTNNNKRITSKLIIE